MVLVKGVLFDVCGHLVVICNNDVVVFRLFLGGDESLLAYNLNGAASNVLLYVLLWLQLVVIAQRLFFRRVFWLSWYCRILWWLPVEVCDGGSWLLVVRCGC